MWIVESSLRVNKVMAIYDLENKKVIGYRDIYEETEMDDEHDVLYPPYPYETFHDTEAQALEYRKNKIDSLPEKMKTCKEIIKELDSVDLSNLGFKQSDYLGSHAEDEEEGYWSKQHTKVSRELKKYKQFIQTSFISINARNIKYDEVVRVEWLGEWKARLVTRDGEEVTTSSDGEYEFIADIFGGNRSDKVLKE